MSTPLTGTGPQVVGQAIHVDSEDKIHKLGELVHSNDGRAFRYCKAGASDLHAGKLQQASAQDTGDHNLAIAAASVGETSITTTGTVTVTANQYADGFVNIADDAGEGYNYGISGHLAATAAAFTVNLKDAIVVALTTATTIDIIKNPYDTVILNPTTISSSPVGVAVIALTASQYGWLQVGGPATVLLDGTVGVGLSVMASDNVAGGVEVVADGAAELLAMVGTAMTAGTTGEYGAIDLRLI